MQQPTTPTYRYRDHVRKLPKLYAMFAVLFGALGLVGALYFSSTFLLFIAAFLAVEFAVIGWFMRRLATTEITLHADQIVMTHHKKRVEIRYDEIEKIDVGHIPWLGGWVRVCGPNGKIRATVVLEGISQFLAGLKHRVDRSNPPAVYNRRKFFGFFKTATYCEQSWQRLGKAALPFIFVAIFVPLFIGDLAPLVAIPLGMGMAVYLWSEFVFARRIARLSDEVKFVAPQRNLAVEESTFIKAAIAWGIVVAPTLALVLLV